MLRTADRFRILRRCSLKRSRSRLPVSPMYSQLQRRQEMQNTTFSNWQLKWVKGISFYRNCGAASVGEWYTLKKPNFRVTVKVVTDVMCALRPLYKCLRSYVPARNEAADRAMNRHQWVSGIGGVYKDITEVSPGSIWYQRAFGENPAFPGTGGQDVEIVKQDPSSSDVECVTNKTLVLVLSSWLVGVNLRNARWGLFWDRCWQVHQGNHAPGNILSSLRLGSWNHCHQSRSCGVTKTDSMELPPCSDQDGVTSSGDIYTYRFP